MAEIFQYLVVLLLAVWTARLAITKGRNGWIWGAAALILGLLPWHLIGVIPVLALMFIKTPVSSSVTQPTPLTCLRCEKSHSDGQHFCTGCGWDLKQTNPPEELDEHRDSINLPSVPTAINSVEVSQVSETTDSPAETQVFVSEHENAKPDIEMPEPDSETPLAEPQEEYVPWGTYDVGEAPTAAIMVSRGIERFSEGKFQEAIDQFTKAIALDANYAEAWERRSEAYAQLGRQEQAEDDRRHLQGLDPSSSPG